MALRRIKDHALRGRPVLYRDRLYVSDCRRGDVAVVDLSDPEKPILIEHFNVPGNPGRLVLHNDALVIPNGYEGLWLERKHSPPATQED